MCQPISALFINNETIPENFINLHSFSTVFSYIIALECTPIYYILSECQRNIIIAQFVNNVINKSNMVELSVFYRWFTYNKPILELLNNPHLWNNIKLSIQYENKHNANKCNLTTNIYVEKHYYEHYPKNKQLPLILHQAIYDLSNTLEHIPVLTNTCLFNNDGKIWSDINSKRKLYSHQINNIKWLLNTEKNIKNKKFSISGFRLDNKNQIGCFIKQLDTYYTMVNSKKYSLISHKIDMDKLENCSLLPKGGVLADNVGLGKTTSFIGLINESKVFDNLTTLVVCPRRLCYQWLEEINIVSDLKATIVNSITQFKKITTDNINSLDILIVPYSFLNNKNYLDYCHSPASEGEFMINNYHWKRVILDEGHEYINKSVVRKRKEPCFVRETLENLKSDFRWICSGTPYATSCDFWKIISYLCPDNKSDLKLLWSIKHFSNMLVNKLFRKHTQESIANEVMIPDAQTETTFLQQSDIEKIIYNSVIGNREMMIQICNHVQVSDQYLNILGNKALSLKEIHRKMTDYYEKKVEKLNTQLINLGKKIDKTKLITDEQNFKKEQLVKNLEETKSKFNIFNSLTDKLEETKKCPICLENLSETTKVVTSCGHFMCMLCACRLFKGNWTNTVKCPMCRERIDGKNLEIIKNDQISTNEINRWGTKMANLISYLNTILKDTNHRVIIFSQWDNMLKLVGKVLDEYHIRHLFLNGSLYVVTSRIKKFKSDNSIRIVLLSSDRAVSGLNLTEATHIILLDTLNTTPEKAKQIEDQAIGRSVRLGQDKNIMIKRFIMESTIEHDYYNRNISVC